MHFAHQIVQNRDICDPALLPICIISPGFLAAFSGEDVVARLAKRCSVGGFSPEREEILHSWISADDVASGAGSGAVGLGGSALSFAL